MRYCFYLIIVLFLVSSCSKEACITDELVGEWIYERELFIKDTSPNIFEDNSGRIEFRIDKSGVWVPLNLKFSAFRLDMDWELDSSGEKITIFRTITIISAFPHLESGTRVFDLKRKDENNYTLTYIKESFSDVGMIAEVEEFENIILTRKP